jgi:uncharacterized protein (DUF1684 family)
MDEPKALDDRSRHRTTVEHVRARREASLRDPMSWLSLVGLHWLTEGDQSFGSDPASAIVLQAARGTVPATAGSLEVRGGRVHLHPSDPALTVGGKPPPAGLELVDDASDDEPTTLELASLRAYVIRRGSERLALRVKDTEAPALQDFNGLDYFPTDPAWRVTGQLHPAEPGATMAVPDIVGDVLAEATPGVVAFELGGVEHRLHALEAQPGHLWLVFGDATNGAETYGGGRFLVTGPVRPDNSVEVDFNLAYNPPCVFSPFATCPLPPDGNRLPVRIEAGERMWWGAKADH